MSRVVENKVTLDLAALMGQIAEITKDLFPGSISICVQDDPDYPQDRYTIIEVEVAAPVANILERRGQWHRRIVQLSGSCRNLRLRLRYPQ